MLHMQCKVSGGAANLPQRVVAAQGRETARGLWKHPREAVCAVSQTETPSYLGTVLFIGCSLPHVFR